MLFADDTKLNFIDVEGEVIQTELNEVKDWLAANKLSLNLNNMLIQINVKQNAIDNVFLIDSKTIIVQTVCKYQGVFVPCPRSKSIEYYKTNFNSIIQYGELIYGCTSHSMLEHFYATKKFLS